VLHRSTLPIATFDLDDLTLIDANGAALGCLGYETANGLPSSLNDLVVHREETDARDALQLLARRAISAFETHAHLKCADGATFDARVWVRSLQHLDAHAALIVFAENRADTVPTWGQQLPATRLRLSGPVVVGAIDLDMHVTRCSADVVELLGREPDALIGHSLVEQIHPVDVSAFLLGLGRAVAEDQSAGMHVRIKGGDDAFVGIRLVVTPTRGAPNTRLGFVMTAETKSSSGDARVGELERHLWRIALEVQAAGVVDGIQRIPDVSQIPGLDELSPRQWDIVTRLLRGERVPDIARATFVSQSTVRNQLGTVYRKLGVHSQTELLSLLRGEQGQSV